MWRDCLRAAAHTPLSRRAPPALLIMTHKHVGSNSHLNTSELLPPFLLTKPFLIFLPFPLTFPSIASAVTSLENTHENSLEALKSGLFTFPFALHVQP